MGSPPGGSYWYYYYGVGLPLEFDGYYGQLETAFSNYDGKLFQEFQIGGIHVNPVLADTTSQPDYWNVPVTITIAPQGGSVSIFNSDGYYSHTAQVVPSGGSVTLTDVPAKLNWLLNEYGTIFVPDKDFVGIAALRVTSTDWKVYPGNPSTYEAVQGHHILNINVTKYDDGMYEAVLEDLKAVDMSGSVPPPGGVFGAPPPGQAQVAKGIDWATLKFLQRGNVNNGKPGTTVNGEFWQVKTAQGSSLTLFASDPIGSQPKATRDNKEIQDITYNCHGFSFGCTGVACPDGKTRDFSMVQDKDVKALLNDAYTEVSAKQVDDDWFTVGYTGKYAFVFYDKNGNAIHSALANVSYGLVDGKLSLENTGVQSKNGWESFQDNTNLKNLIKTYPEYRQIKIYKLK